MSKTQKKLCGHCYSYSSYRTLYNDGKATVNGKIVPFKERVSFCNNCNKKIFLKTDEKINQKQVAINYKIYEEISKNKI